MPAEPVTLGGRYRLGERLGGGAIGDVFVAEHVVTGRRFAVKLLNDRHRERPDAVERFRREAVAAGRIEHPHIVAVIDFGHDAGGPPYLVMELLQGESLDATLSRERRLAWSRVRAIGLQIADALRAAHAGGVVHRDLKPANCLRTRSGADEDSIKIVDFGLAKLRSIDAELHSLTDTGALLGTLRYMAPEQAADSAHVDARADLYSLAVMLFRMFTGQLPIQGDTEASFLLNLLRLPPSQLSAAAPDLLAPRGLAMFFERALAKRPDDRFASADEFAAALHAITEDAAATSSGADTDPLAHTLLARPVGDEQTATAATIESLCQQVQARAAFYTDAKSRWTDERYRLPGGGQLTLVSGDLCLEQVDVLVCALVDAGLTPRTLAHRLCEFGGPAVEDGIRGLRTLVPGQIHTLDAGRLRARRLVIGVVSARHLGLQHLREQLARLVAGALDVVDRLQARSLGFPLIVAGAPGSGALGFGRSFALVSLVEAFARNLGSAASPRLSEVRLVVDDGGRRIVELGGSLTVHIPGVSPQRFVLGHHPSMLALAQAIVAAVPLASRPTLADLGATWSLRDYHSHTPLDPALFAAATTMSPQAAGLRHGASLELVPL